MPDTQSQKHASDSRVVKVDEPWMGYDYIARIPIQSLGLKAKPDEKTFYKKADQVFDWLKRGLGDRLIHLNIIVPKSTSLDLRNGHLDLGIVAEPSVALRAVDRGPEQEDEEQTRNFRNLWGSKSELRRFKDGAIQESVVWSSTEARHLLHEIVKHLFTTHVGAAAAESMTFWGNDFSTIMPGFTPRLAPFEPILAAFRTVEKDIRDLDGLPLSIRQISPASSAISSSSVHLPYAAKRRPARPMDVVVQFEGSARWPDDLQAIQMTKVAFLLKMHELFGAQHKQVTTRVGLENENADMLNRSFLELAYPVGLMFRVRIHHDREQTLTERLLKDRDTTPEAREAAALSLAEYKRYFDRRPTHCTALQATVTRHAALSGTIRLVKRWFNAHLLGSHFHEELIEIMCIRSFVHSNPWKPPSSPQSGFLRTLLFLSRWDWETTPLLVDFDGNSASAELVTAQTRFEAWRKIDPAMNRVVLFAATNLDTDGNTWTERSPSKVVANRMTSLASAALSSLKQQGIELDMTRLFKASLKGYDFRINLSKPFTLPKRTVQGASKYKNLQDAVVITDNSTSGFDPVQQFVSELKWIYGEVMVLFYDPDGGPMVAGIWDPTKGSRRWKVNLAYSTTTTTTTATATDDGGEVMAEVNKKAILSEIARIGGDMIESINTQD